MEMEKYYAATEFDPVEEASDDIEDLTVERDEAVSELMEWDGHERVVISPADMSRVSPLSGLEAGMHVPRSRYLAALADKLEADLHKAEENLGSIVRGAEENYKKNAATMAEEADGYEYDVPFSFEGGDEEPEMPTNCTNVGIPGETIEYRYSPAAREEMHTPICDYKEPEKRWHHAMSLNPHKVTVLLHYTLEKASRALAGSGVSARGDI